MDFTFVGIIDIIVIVGVLISIILGVKKGFVTKAIGLVGTGVAIWLGLLFAGQLAGLFKSTGLIYNQLADAFSGNITKGVDALNASGSTITASAIMQEGFGLPSFVAFILSFLMGGDTAIDATISGDAARYTDLFALKTTWLISFVIIFLVVLIVFFIIKRVVKSLREASGIVRTVDGLLGALLYVAIFAAIVCVIFFVLNLIYSNIGADSDNAFVQFLNTDLMLTAEAQANAKGNTFRMSGYLFKLNPLTMIIGMFTGTK